MAAPGRGDIVWLDSHPQAGHEQSGRRPAVVLSPRIYHQKTSLVIVCPITGTIKGYPFEVVLPDGLPLSGAILVDQVRSLDRHARNLESVGRVPEETMAEVLGKLASLLSL